MTKKEVMKKYGIHTSAPIGNEVADKDFILMVKNLAKNFMAVYEDKEEIVSCETLRSEVQRNDNRGE